MLKETKKKGKKAIFLRKKGSEGRSEIEGENLHLLSTISGGRNPSNQDLKFTYLTRATRGYRQHAVSPKILGFEKKI